ncbi:MAG: NUDIX domain-containing protein [Chitinophagaceae bacterium]|jgi:8-oxo-dGTP diphosphatase|nr:NUDIX domain-containing protein [Chitinophagaceae bacterium]
MTPNRKKPNINTTPVELMPDFQFAISVDCVIFGYEENTLKVLLIKSDLPAFANKWSLLGDLLHPDEDLDAASYRVLRDRTGLDNVFLEQVHTFGQVNRHPAGRVVTTAYYSLVNIRHHQLSQLDNELHWHPVNDIHEMAFDHKKILDTCLKHLQKKVQEEPVIFNLLEQKFSLRDLQNLYEAILDVKLDRRNFRKKLFTTDLLTDIHEMEQDVPHRPGKLYTFNHARYAKMKKKTFVGIDF